VCYYAIDGKDDFCDEEANSLRKAFLKSPLKFSRLSSRFTMRRFHPVQKRWKAHLGTDYAAPRGTLEYLQNTLLFFLSRFIK
jgi:murein DD-endopeptidase MepM/ murein hydrolase activator NlpD